MAMLDYSRGQGSAEVWSRSEQFWNMVGFRALRAVLESGGGSTVFESSQGQDRDGLRS